MIMQNDQHGDIWPKRILNPMQQTILLCAGGTGGHVFPALSLAHDLMARDLNVVLITDSRAEKYAHGMNNIKIEVISSATFPPSIIGKIRAVFALGYGYIQSLCLMKKYNPAVVVGFGGYPSLPPMLAASNKKIPTLIHESNAVLGRANQFLARKANKIALSLPDMSTLNNDEITRAVVTGNPVRYEIAELYTQAYKMPAANQPFNLLIMGGSLGAKVMAKYVPDALANLPQNIRQCLNVTQQCHDDDILKTQEKYKSAGIKAILKPFFDNVPELLKTSHLIIGRSGASTVSEIAVSGTPAIYIPYPHHADQQQKVNAESIAQSGGAWVIEEKNLTSQLLSEKIKKLVESSDALLNASAAARACAYPDATKKLGNIVVSLIQRHVSV